MRFLLILSFFYTFPLMAAKTDEKKSPYDSLNFLGSVLERVEKEYVDPVPFEKLVDSAVEGLLSGLDRHSYLIKSDEYADMRNQMSGEFGGLGIEVVVEDGLIRVITAMDDSPAQKAGIMPGDLITHVDDHPISGMSSDKSIQKLRGKPGTKVKIHIRRDKKPMEFTIKRELVKTKPVKIKREGDFVVARIATFMDANMVTKFMNEYDKVKKDKKPIKGMVLDMRNNGGGLLDEAVAITSLFIEKGKEVVSTRGRRKDDVQRYTSTDKNYFREMPLVVLVNRATASAPEIVAGALKDYKRAIIMGEETYGKGSVQTVVPLKDKRAIRLTTARYYTPSGDTIQDVGVKPDIDVPLGILEKVDLGPRYSEKDLAGGVKKKTQNGDEDDDEKDKEKKEKDSKPAENEKENSTKDTPADESEAPLIDKDAKDKTDKTEKTDKTDKSESDKENSDKEDKNKDHEKTNTKDKEKDKAKKEPIDYQMERALDLLKTMEILKAKK